MTITMEITVMIDVRAVAELLGHRCYGVALLVASGASYRTHLTVRDDSVEQHQQLVWPYHIIRSAMEMGRYHHATATSSPSGSAYM